MLPGGARRWVCGLVVCGLAAVAGAAPLARPILFVGQVPHPDDFTTIASVFGNHRSQVDSAARGGDLFLLFPSGKLRNLTREAGFGNDGFQGARAIAVRDPAVDWTGTKALFSMVIGAPVEQYEEPPTRWQIYEVSGLGENETAKIVRLAKQPAEFNNVTPIYSPDGRILFTSDRPRSGEAHLYPQLDEYEEAPVVSGLWSLDPQSGDLALLDHSPSGAFSPLVDAAGRVVYTRWDHLQRDQQADSDAEAGGAFGDYGTFDFADETAGAARSYGRVEIFPEPRSSRTDLLAGTNLQGHSFNHFFPWEIFPDGSGHETLNHIGRHELHGYFDRALNDDGELEEFIDDGSGRFNPNPIQNFLMIDEDPGEAGRFVGVDAPEFYTHAAGCLVEMLAPRGRPADEIRVSYLTHPSTCPLTEQAPAGSTGRYRDPLVLASGGLVAAHTAETRLDANQGTRALPRSRYSFRLRALRSQGGYWVPDQPLTAGIQRSVSWYDPDVLVSYSGELWELQPVEVRARPKPPVLAPTLEAPELAAFAAAGVDPAAFRSWLAARDLALAVTRNVTTRDAADRQQPFNLQAAGGVTSQATGGKLYQVSHLQLFQGDQVRGLGGVDDPRQGRRVLARRLHEPAVKNPPSGGPPASVKVAADGSVAALLPAHRAVTWQLLSPQGEPVVRERYWLTLRAGEVRVCPSCHGANSRDQLGRASPENSPQALRSLLDYWKKELAPKGLCQPTATRLCLQNQRFGAEIEWRDFANRSGAGSARTLTGDTGAFWFFDASNLEVIVKVLDGRSLNGKYWVFYGALSNVEYTLTVTDYTTGASKTYRNPAGTLGSRGDTTALPGSSSAGEAAPASAAIAAWAPACAAGPGQLCLQGGRFRVDVAWRDFQNRTGAGTAVPLTGDTGAFWFFDQANLELVVKVLDGRSLNGKHWVFYGALSNVEYTLTVTDTQTGAVRTYSNPAGNFASRADTGAF